MGPSTIDKSHQPSTSLLRVSDNEVLETRPFEVNRRPVSIRRQRGENLSLALTEVDTSKIILKTSLKNEEDWISGEGNLKRLESAGDIRIDLGIFWAFYKNQHLIPERFKEKTDENTTYVFL